MAKLSRAKGSSAVQSVLKWVGGKGRLYPRLAAALGRPDVLVEPFCGSAIVSRRMVAEGRVPPSGVVLADANAALVWALTWAATAPLELHAAVAALGTSRAPYVAVRAAYNDALRTPGAAGTLDTAARMVWLNRAGFNGLYRVNADGRFNTPVGGPGPVVLPGPEVYLEHAAALGQARFLAQRFEDTLDYAIEMQRAAPGARVVVYCDPPYLPAPRSGAFTAYHRLPFGPTAHKALAEACQRAAADGVRCVVSNAYHDEVVGGEHTAVGLGGLYPPDEGWALVDALRVPRTVGGKAATRHKAPEGLWAIGPVAP